MNIWISRDGQKYGPYTVKQLEEWLAQGKVAQYDLAWNQGQSWRPLGDVLREAGCVIPPPPPQVASIFPAIADASGNPDVTLRRIADYERISGVVWIVIGVLQCLILIGIIAGIWNIFAGVSRMKAVPIILARSPSVPSMFEGVGQLIVIGLINAFLGGIFGVLCVIFDFIIRDMVLKNRHLFEQADAVS